MKSARNHPVIAQVRAGNPVPGVPEVADQPLAEALLASILTLDRKPSGERASRGVTRRRPGVRMRIGVGIAVLLVAGGIAFAAVTLPEAPPEVRAPIEAALTLPSPEVERLSPIPGGIREVLRGENSAGTWHLYTVQTQGRGTLVTYGFAARASQSVTPGGAIGKCSALGDAVIDGPCMGGGGPFLPGEAPSAPITTAAHPAYTIAIGRVADSVRTVEVARSDGSTVTGWVANGYYLIIDLKAKPITGQIRALDEEGRTIANAPVAMPMRG